MNRFTKVFLTIFIVFIIALVLNSIDRLNSPLPIDLTALTTNWIGAFPFIMLIFLGLYFILQR